MLSSEYSVTLACDLLDCAKSSYYHQAEPPDDTKLKAAIETVSAEWPTYGYRRITAQLRRQGWQVNRKRIQRLVREMDLPIKIKRKKRSTTNSRHGFPRYPNLVLELDVVRPDQVWVSDITCVRLLHDFVYLAVIMDVFTRCIRGWHLERSLDHSLTLTALQRALAKRTPEIHHSDQGVQYAATAYTQALQEANVQISMAEVGKAWQMAMLNVSYGQSRKTKLTYRSMWTILMPANNWGGFSTMSTCTSVSILRWVTSLQPNSRRFVKQKAIAV